MDLTGDKDQDLVTIKDCVREWEDYWKDNASRYTYYMNFVCVTTIDAGDESLLADMNRPAMMFNQLDAIGCKLLGEFASQEPGIVVAASDGIIVDEQIANTVECVEAHMRHDLAHSQNGNASCRVFKDDVYGGYGCMEVYTEYVKGTFKQCIKHQRLNPTMVGFDPMATEPHKGDGAYCYKKIYMTKHTVQMKFGKEIADSISYVASSTSNGGTFSWSYQNTKQQVAVIIEFYTKKERKGKLLLLSNGEEIDEKEYKANLKEWEKSDIMIPPPTITDSRDEVFTEIVRYTVCESQIIEVDGELSEDTIFEMLPLVFFDGNSAETQVEAGGCLQQVTRSYFHNARDAQKFKDFAGQSFAGELQSTMQSKIIAPEEAIPEQYLKHYLEPQHNSLLPYKSMYKDDPNHRIEPPQIINRPDIPQSIPAAFYGADKLIQTTLGNYDTQLAMQPDVSGKAMQEGSMESDAASKPYFDNFFEGLNRVAQIRLNLFPKVYKTPRSIPVTLKNGKKTYAIINSDEFKAQPGMQQDQEAQQNARVDMDYDPNSLMVQVHSGPNSSVQKRNAVDQITKLMNVSPMMNALFSGPGVEILIDNLDFRGSDRLKSIVGPFQQQQVQEQAEMKQQAQQMQALQTQLQQLQGMVLQSEANKNNAAAHKSAADSVIANKKEDNAEAMGVAKLMLEREDKEAELAIKAQDTAIKQEKVDLDALLSRQQLSVDQVDQVLRAEQIDLDRAHQTQSHVLEVNKHLHEKNMDEQALEQAKESSKSEDKSE